MNSTIKIGDVKELKFTAAVSGISRCECTKALKWLAVFLNFVYNKAYFKLYHILDWQKTKFLIGGVGLMWENLRGVSDNPAERVLDIFAIFLAEKLRVIQTGNCSSPICYSPKHLSEGLMFLSSQRGRFCFFRRALSVK